MARYWTVDKARDAVKAAFFSRGVSVLGDPENLWLRYTEIRAAISASGSGMGDRMLSRALRELVASGHLRKRDDGKFALYNLVIPRADSLKALGQAEAAAIETSCAIGGWGDPVRGWAVFGIPPPLPKRFRREFQQECLRHQEELRVVVEGVWEEAIEAFVGPTRKRVPRRVFLEGKRAVGAVAELMLIGATGLSYSGRFWQVIDRAVPGAAKSFFGSMQEGLGPASSLADRISAFVSKAGGKPLEVIRPEIDRDVAKIERRLQKAAAKTDAIWAVLTPSERNRANRRLQSAIALTVSLVSVVHF